MEIFTNDYEIKHRGPPEGEALWTFDVEFAFIGVRQYQVGPMTWQKAKGAIKTRVWATEKRTGRQALAIAVRP